MSCGLVATAVTLACLRIAGAADTAAPAAGAAVSQDETAIRAAGAAYRKALADQDLDAVAAFWAPDADYVDQVGRVYKVRPGLARAKHASQQASHLALLAPKTETHSVRAVTADVAVEDGSFDRQVSDPGQVPHGHYTAIWVRRDGRWLLDGIRETPVRHQTGAHALRDLAWMVGEWEAEGPQGSADLSCSWGQDKNYILAQMRIQPKGEKPVSATQLIGWDPIQQRVRSFLFDSRGAYTEGVWTNEGDAWTVKATGVMPDGQRSNSTRLYSRVDDNTAVWESIDDDVDGQPRPGVRMKLTRKAAKK